MTYLKTLARAVGLGLCVAALSGSALADPGNGSGNGPATTPPGQEQKAETPAAAAPTPAPAPQAAQGQAQKAENQAKQAAKKAAPKPAAKTDKPAKAAKPAKPAKAAKPAKTSGSYKETSRGTDLKKGMAHKHTICHATGSDSNPYVRITPSVSGVFHGHMDHQGDEDIVPPFVYKGTTYSQNWDAAGQALFNANCAAPASSAPLTPVTPSSTQTGNCPTTITTTEQVLVGIWHATGSYKNGERKFVLISPSEKSAHMNGKHADDKGKYETRTVTRTVSGENCASVSVTSSNNTTNNNTTNTESQTAVTAQTQSSQVASQSTAASGQAPAGGVAGVVSPANQAAEKADKKDKPAGGVLGAIASAPEAVAETATTGTLPFTGIPLWIAALIGSALLAAGLVLRRSA